MDGKLSCILFLISLDLFFYIKECLMTEEIVKFKDKKGEEFDLRITEEFRNGLDLLEKTNESLFITGKAGCGKSTLLNYFVSTTEKEVVVLAFTGLAAINVEGETIHSFFGFPLGFIDSTRIKPKNDLVSKLKSVDTIVIDEVSMVRADMIDAMDKALQVNRGDSRPFGGVQMVFIGDLYQLPPIVGKDIEEIYYKYYKTPFFFSAEVFLLYQIPYLNLETIHRQKDDKFIDILNSVRERSKDLYTVLEGLNDNVLLGKGALIKEMVEKDTICITTTNKKSKEINDYFLDKLKTEGFTYGAKIIGDYDKKSYPTNPELFLKVGSKVMFIRNDPKKMYVNGDVGIVEYLDKNTVVVKKGNIPIKLEKATWEKNKYEHTPSDDGGRGRIEKTLVGSFEQFPLKLAWSITIHKAQGQTYNRVFVDFHYGTFTSGQAYVALSRSRSLEGLLLKREVAVTDIILDDRIKQFYTMFKNIMDY
jgi:ATP-dependent DNA helicase PIF1